MLGTAPRLTGRFGRPGGSTLMALLSFLRRKDSKPQAAAPVSPAPGDDNGPVHQARVRARRRLIGAVVLLAIGVVGFPMLFETQPRPLPGDIPIELPRRDGAAAAPRPGPVPRHAPAVTELPPEPAAAVASAPGDAAPVPPPPAELPAAAVAKVEPKPEPVKAEAPKPEPVKAEPPPKPHEPPKPDGERARALLEGRADKPAPAAVTVAASEARAAGRFVVQVGAYTDAATLREVRAKVEKLGLKTYTQSVDTAAGTRTRVRVGPFPDKAEAERASARLKSAGLPGAVLTL
ncbi:MAG: SPOR domain-containing protein [Rubrivivax sp.]